MFCLLVAHDLIIPTLEGEYDYSLVIWEVPTASIFRVKEKSHVSFSVNLFLPLRSSQPQKTALGCTQIAVMMCVDWKTRSSCML
jgi:hypothetical protein